MATTIPYAEIVGQFLPVFFSIMMVGLMLLVLGAGLARLALTYGEPHE